MDEGWRVDCFAIEEGDWQPQPANICAIPGHAGRALLKRDHRERGDLYLHAQVLRTQDLRAQDLRMQPGPNSVLSQPTIDALREAAVKAFYGSGGSVTRGLRAALQAGNEWLFTQLLNSQDQSTLILRTEADRRVLLGLHYAVVRDRQPGDTCEVYLGQIGPAMATWIHGDAVDLYPSESIWLRSETPSLYEIDREPPAGWRRDVEPNLFHITLTPGDILILAGPQLHHLVPARALRQALAERDTLSSAQVIQRLAQGHDMSGLVLEWGAIGQTAPIGRPGVADEVPPARRQAAAVLPGSLGLPSSLNRRQRPPEPETEEPESEMAAQPAENGEQDESVTAPPPQTPTTSQPGAEPQENAEKPRRRPPAGVQVLPETEPLPQEEGPLAAGRSPSPGRWASPDSTASREMAPSQGGRVAARDNLRGNLSAGVERARQGTEELLTRVLPETAEQAADAEPERHSLSLAGRALLAVAMVIPLVMALIVVLTRLQYDRAHRRVFAQIQELAQARYDAASMMENIPYRRQALREALATAQEGLAVDPQDELLNSLVRQIEHNLDGIDGIERISRFTQLAQLADDGTQTSNASPWMASARIVVQDLDLFLLNRGNGRVYRYLLNNAGDALQAVGADGVMLQRGDIQKGVRIGEMVDITWMEAEGQRVRDGFAALDRAGSLITYDLERGLDVSPVANSDMWIKPIALGCYAGNIYVLDPILGTILKHIPIDDAYVNPPSHFINPTVHVDLTGAVDMAIDGSVYVLFADGKIIKFFKGDPQPFDMLGLPSPMRSPTSLFISGKKEPEADGYVYVVDNGNERILEFDKAGNYIRQFQTRAGLTQFKAIQGIYVDGQRNSLFVLSGGKLWFANLPPRKVG